MDNPNTTGLDNLGPTQVGQDIIQATATGEQIARIVNNIQEVVLDETRTDILMACLSMALILQEPDITPVNLVKGVKESSQFIALFLSSLNPLTPNMVN